MFGWTRYIVPNMNDTCCDVICKTHRDKKNPKKPHTNVFNDRPFYHIYPSYSLNSHGNYKINITNIESRNCRFVLAI